MRTYSGPRSQKKISRCLVARPKPRAASRPRAAAIACSSRLPLLVVERDRVARRARPRRPRSRGRTRRRRRPAAPGRPPRASAPSSGRRRTARTSRAASSRRRARPAPPRRPSRAPRAARRASRLRRRRRSRARAASAARRARRRTRCSSSLPGSTSTPARAAGDHEHRVVRRELAVDRDALEGALDRRVEQAVERVRRRARVGLDEAEHRGERGRDHAPALRLRRTAAPRRRRERQLERRVLRPAVGRHDRVREVVRARRERRERRLDAREHRAPLEPEADHARRGDADARGPRTRARRPPSPTIASATAMPCSPLETLALPLFTTTARSRASVRAARDRHRRGDERVAREARGRDGVVVVATSSPTSSWPERLIPQATPAARKPAGSSPGSSSATPSGGSTQRERKKLTRAAAAHQPGPPPRRGRASG